MKTKTILLMTSIIISNNVSANDNISYNWAEISYVNKKQGGFTDGDAIGLSGSFALSKSFYLTLDASRYKGDFGASYENSYGFSLGFHKEITDRTDFYAELGFRRNEPRNFNDLSGNEIKIGTRTAFSAKWELITLLGYKDLNIGDIPGNLTFNTSRGGLNFGVSALYKFSDHSSLHFGLNEEDSSVATTIGYRFNW